MLLLCKATIAGDCQAIRSLISEPTSSASSPWYLSEVHKLLSQGTVKMYCPIAVSIMVKKYDVTKELLLCTDLDMRRKQVDWSRLKLTILHPSWIYSIAPWVVNLKLGNNNLHKVPDDFSRALQLRRLDLSSNLIEKFTINIFALPNLESLNLSQNKIKELPENIRWSPSLINLDLSSNFLTTLPSSIQFSMLEILQLSGNKFTSVPKSICRIRTLTTLDLSSMPISVLPKEIEMLEKLANLNVTDCDLPPETVPAGTVRFVRAFVKSRSRSSKPSNYVKLVILSNSSVGKLVMYSRLRQIVCPPGSHLPEMEFFQWQYKPFKLFSIKVMFNTWMVGIQKEYRAFYPCLYTANALYILVWDMTKTGDIQHQLKPYIDGIASRFHSANVLVIAILPEPFDSWADANSNNLSKKLSALFSHSTYQNLHYHGFIPLSNSSSGKEDSVDIRMKIHEVASQMEVNKIPVVGRQYAENYFNLIPVVERERTNLKTSGRPGIMEESMLWSLFECTVSTGDSLNTMEFPLIISFLQEIGFLMHFDDPNERLNQFYFLHPEWVVSTVYHILQHLHYYHASHPVVSTQKLSALMKLSSANLMSAMIRLMVRYTLLLPISDSQYIIPSLLPHNAPPLAIRQVGCYRRQIIPKGKPLPENFWYHMISNILFHLPRLFNSQDQMVKTFLLTRAPAKDDDSAHPNEDFPEVLEEVTVGFSPEKKAIEHSTPVELLPVIYTKPRSMTEQTEPAQKYDGNQGGAIPHRSRAKMSSPAPPRLHSNSDPIQISRGIVVWSTGIQLMSSTKTKVSIYSQFSDLGLEESGIEICATDSDEGRTTMAKLCWFIQKLLDHRYPEFSHHIHSSSQFGLTQIILCPQCLCDQNLVANGGVTNFIIDTCLVALKEQDTFSHICHHHTKANSLKDLIPDYMLVDLPSELNLNAGSFTYQESRPVYKDSYTMLCEGILKEQQPVFVKKHMFVDTKSFTAPFATLRQELQMLTYLNHPNIIKTYGFCLTPPTILLEKSPLGTLLQKLSDNEQKISRLVRFHIARQVASALSYLHEKNIVYRTLKTDSIFTWSLNFEDEVSIKLAHFERAVFATPSGIRSRAEFSFYPAPEMLRYEFSEEYNEKVDIYSFGILMYELVARWQPFALTNKTTVAHKPKLTGLSTYGFQTLVKLMEECWEENMYLRPSAAKLVSTLADTHFQCHLSTQTLRDCISVRGCCYVPSLTQVWAYGEYNVFRTNADGTELLIEGTQVFILNATNLTVQGSLELKERANAICTVDSKVWIGMLETCIHVYDSTTFSFTNRIYVNDSVTCIATNDKYAFVGLANGTLTYYEKLKFPDVSDSIKIGEKAIISMIPVGDCLWIICGNEIVIVCADDDDITITHRLTACQPKDQVYDLVLSSEGKLVFSIIRGSLTLVCWDVGSCKICGSLDLTGVISNVCKSANLETSNTRLLCLECSQDVVWVGVSVGVIILLTATPQPEVVSWFVAHRNTVRCLMSVADLNEEGFEVVLSGGYGEESYIKTADSFENGVIMSWQSLNTQELLLLAQREKLW